MLCRFDRREPKTRSPVTPPTAASPTSDQSNRADRTGSANKSTLMGRVAEGFVSALRPNADGAGPLEENDADPRDETATFRVIPDRIGVGSDRLLTGLLRGPPLLSVVLRLSLQPKDC